MTKFKKQPFGNLAKLVFWSILASQNRSFANSLRFFHVSFSGEKFFKGTREMILHTFRALAILHYHFDFIVELIELEKKETYKNPVLVIRTPQSF